MLNDSEELKQTNGSSHRRSGGSIRRDVMVLGGGLSGLAAAAQLKAHGLDPLVLEGGDQVGASWQVRHPNLRLNTHRRLSGLPGLPMPKSAGAYPSKASVIEYLQDYARQMKLEIRLNEPIDRIARTPDGWLLHGKQQDFETKHLVVAMGRDRVPSIPDWPGREVFRGDLRHAANFGAPEEYANKKVLVVGAGNSGTDLLNHLAGVDTAAIWVSLRKGPSVFPKYFAGLPVQLLSPLMDRLPLRLVDKALDLTSRLAFGDLTAYGLPKQPLGGASRLLAEGVSPAVDDGMVKLLKSGRAKVVGEVERFSEADVVTKDGQVLQPDVVLCATGYATGLDPLFAELGVLDQRGMPVINGIEQSAAAPGLWFVGMRPQLSGYFQLTHRESREIAEAIAQEVFGRRPSAWKQTASTFRRESTHPQSGEREERVLQ